MRGDGTAASGPAHDENERYKRKEKDGEQPEASLKESMAACRPTIPNSAAWARWVAVTESERWIFHVNIPVGIALVRVLP